MLNVPIVLSQENAKTGTNEMLREYSRAMNCTELSMFLATSVAVQVR